MHYLLWIKYYLNYPPFYIPEKITLLKQPAVRFWCRIEDILKLREIAKHCWSVHVHLQQLSTGMFLAVCDYNLFWIGLLD